MKILVIGPDIRDRQRVHNFTGVQAFYICRELRRRGVELEFAHSKFNSPDAIKKGKPTDPVKYFSSLKTDADHILALGLRYFTTVPQECGRILKSKVRGAVTHMHDGVIHDSWVLPGVDCTFMFRDDSTRLPLWKERYADRNCYIGWAADPALIYSQQVPGELCILIDHPYYKSGRPDMTKELTADVVLFAKSGIWKDYFRTIKIRRLANGGAVDVNFNSPETEVFDRDHVSFERIAEEYRKTSVFVVTHKESVGLTILETGFAGALTVTPSGYIPRDRLDTVCHVEFKEGSNIPWDKVLSAIDVEASRKKAAEQSWDKVVDRMLRYFGGYKQ